MTPVFLDFETYWSQTHTLKKVHPITYVMHQDTEIQSVAFRIGHGETDVLFGEDTIKEWAGAFDWSDKLVVGHNLSGFDSMLCAWRLGINPKAWGCTAAMARPLFAKTVGCSLRAVAMELGLGKKLSLAATNTKGKRLEEFSAEEREAMRVYNKQDTDLCAAIFYRLAKETPPSEFKLIDMTIRMLTEPQFEVDTAMLETSLMQERANKRSSILKVADTVALTSVGLPEHARIAETKSVLASAPKFAKFLKASNQTVPMKPSPTNPDKMIPALAKTDEDFIALMDSDNEIVAAAARARLGVKSTILETRMETFLLVQERLNGKMPIALNYYGADTTGRWSGGFKMNHQNLPRVIPGMPKLSDALRKCLRAPAGYKVVVADLSGIELRVNHYLWQVESSMDMFDTDPHGADLYKDFARALYKTTEISKQQRQVGKVAHLGLGFGAGAKTFRTVAKLMGGVDLSEEESKDIVQQWRTKYWKIPDGWKTCNSKLRLIKKEKLEKPIPLDDWGLCSAVAGGIRTPVGMIRYPGVRQETDEEGDVGWWYGHGRHKTRIYGGKIVENLVQHLARGVISDMALAFRTTPLGKKYKLSHTVHDELIYVVKDRDAQQVLDCLQDIMQSGVDWWPDLMTSSEGDIAQTYGDAK